MYIPENKTVVLFDGYCHLCSRTVQFILKHDRNKHFIFAPINSEPGIQLREKFHIREEIDSVIVINNGKAFYYSDSVFEIATRLGGIWKCILIFKIIPKSWADKIYQWIAANRLKWFGKRDSCFLLPNRDNDFSQTR